MTQNVPSGMTYNQYKDKRERESAESSEMDLMLIFPFESEELEYMYEAEWRDVLETTGLTPDNYDF